MSFSTEEHARKRAAAEFDRASELEGLVSELLNRVGHGRRVVQVDPRDERNTPSRRAATADMTRFLSSVDDRVADLYRRISAAALEVDPSQATLVGLPALRKAIFDLDHWIGSSVFATAYRRIAMERGVVLSFVHEVQLAFDTDETAGLISALCEAHSKLQESLAEERARRGHAESNMRPPKRASKAGRKTGARDRADAILQKALEREDFSIDSLRALAKRAGCDESSIRDLPKWDEYKTLRQASQLVQADDEADRALDDMDPQ